MNQTANEYGVLWEEFKGRAMVAVTKEKFFKTEQQREQFIEKLTEKSNFIAIVAFCG